MIKKWLITLPNTPIVASYDMPGYGQWINSTLLQWEGSVSTGVGAWTRVWKGGVVLCLCELWARIICVDGRFRNLYSVLGGYLRILGDPVFNPVAPYGYLLPNVYLIMADIANPDLFVWCCRTWICLDITRFYEEQHEPSSGYAWPACPKRYIGPPLLGDCSSNHFCKTCQN